MNTFFSTQQADAETARFFQRVYAWMFVGLALTGVIAYIVAGNEAFYKPIILNSWIFFGLLIAQFILVATLSSLVSRMNSTVATICYLAYCSLVGLTFSVIFLVFTIASIGQVFFLTAGIFGIMSLYGYFTKTDLSSWGNLLFMTLIGVILAGVINLWWQNSMFDFIVSCIGVVLFTALTAYDTQKIKAQNILGNEGTDDDKKEAIMGALKLYLDFINLFLKLLRLLGKRRR